MNDLNRKNILFAAFAFLFFHGPMSGQVNTPILQVKTFVPTQARYIKLTALGNTQDNNVVGYGEFDVITD